MQVYKKIAQIISEIALSKKDQDIEDARNRVKNRIRTVRAAGQTYKTYKREGQHGPKGSKYRDEAAKHLKVALKARRQAMQDMETAEKPRTHEI